MERKTFLATLVAAALTGSGAMAATVSIDQIGAIWQNPTGAATTIDNGDGDPTTGGETVSISWGTPATNAGQSGYAFDPAAVSFNATDGVAYSLGTFTHFNRPITGGSLDTVELLFHFAGTPVAPIAGPLTSFGAIFNISHDETTNTGNVGNCGAGQQTGTPCDDFVTVSAVGGASEDVTVGDATYTFTLLGFSTDGSAGSFSNIFTTEEGQDNSSDLWFTYSVSVVPLPAAGWLLLAGVGALGAAGRRRRKAA